MFLGERVPDQGAGSWKEKVTSDPETERVSAGFQTRGVRVVRGQCYSPGLFVESAGLPAAGSGTLGADHEGETMSDNETPAGS